MSYQMDNLSIRQMREDDIKSAMRLKNAEGWNQTEADWKMLATHNPELCLVACVEDKVIGTVTAINYHDEVAWIGMMLVSRESRGRGVSKRLLGAVLEKLDGCHSVKLDATPAGIPVYRKLGFVEELEIHRMTVPNLKSLNDPNYSESLHSIENADIPEITSFDKPVFGTDRTKLIRSLVKNLPGQCWVAKRDGETVGFVLGRKGTLFNYIGPVMAQSTNVAKILIARAARNLVGHAVVIDILADKVALHSWLSELGFCLERSLYRMYHKSNRYCGDVKCQFAISGPELG